MNLLHWFFEKLNPEGPPNWLSIQYSRWKLSRRERYNREYLKRPPYPIHEFKVAGASGVGLIAISRNATNMTAQTYGFGFNVSWNDTGLYCGVVLGLEEANRLAIHIIEQYSRQTKSEAELVAESYSRFNLK